MTQFVQRNERGTGKPIQKTLGQPSTSTSSSVRVLRLFLRFRLPAFTIIFCFIWHFLEFRSVGSRPFRSDSRLLLFFLAHILPPGPQMRIFVYDVCIPKPNSLSVNPQNVKVADYRLAALRPAEGLPSRLRTAGRLRVLVGLRPGGARPAARDRNEV